ncbi:hypothetical protein RI129_011179 [Pyrocoelia pectoralis]|uniref:FAD dependent oxidoreductase domain-containing protein n=1 Tax=Pyrocoelia pectoralis TaxID=417401 RepID=A0AAN7V7F9_9COLE
MFNVAIIGGGIIGLSTATVLQDHLKSSVQITVFTEKVSPNTTGDVSAGLWTHFLVDDEDLEKIRRWGKQTHDRFFDLWRSGYANDTGIIFHPVKLMMKHGGPSSNSTTVFGEHPMSKDQVEEVNQALKTHFPAGVTYVTFACQISKYLPFLQIKFVENGGKIELKKISNLEELRGYDIIVNCTGIGATALTVDTKLSPLRGQIIRVNAPWQFSTTLTDTTYIVSNEDKVILGGTAQIGDYGTEVRTSDAERILHNTSNLVPSLKNAEIVSHMVGLRPGRNGIRLETEIRNINGRNVPVVHNYGHGGSGVTLSYGSALATLQHITEILNTFPKSKL